MNLLGSNGSPYVRKVRIVLEEKGIAHEQLTVPSVSPEVAGANPLGKIPALIRANGRALYDSPVICEYLDGLSPEKRLIPEAFEDRIEVRRWEALADGVMDATVNASHEDRHPVGQRRGPEWIAKQVAKIEQGLAAMERDLGGRTWCHGSSFTLADAAAGAALFYIDRVLPAMDWRTSCPNLGRFADQLAARASFKKSAPPPP